MKLAVDILVEMGLVTRHALHGGSCLTVVENPSRVDINHSQILQRLQN